MRKQLSFLVGLLCVVAMSYAQNVTLTGTITDAKDGTPLSGVSVTSKQTRAGVKTDVRGSYSIVVPSGKNTLVFSYVGYQTQEVNVGNSLTFDVKLVSSESSLSEIVVVGYGTQRRREVTGNLSTVRGESVAQKPVQSFESGLAGKASGVQISNSNGLANNPPVFRIRGTNSISLSSYPLVVVDGVPTYVGDQGGTSAPANGLASINPNDIETIDIAKDAAASAIYGSRAANGVVFITTKRGKSGKPRVSYDGWAGWSKAQRLPEMLDAFQYTDYKNEALANAKANNPSITGSFNLTNGPDGKPINTNWNDYIYRTGFSHSHNVNVSGGSDNTNYYFSAGYTDQEGILRKNDFTRANVLMNVDSRVSRILSLGGKLSYSNEKNLVGGTSGGLPGEGFSIAGAGRIALVLPSNISPYNNDGSYNYASGSAIGSMGNIVNGAGPVTYYNPVLTMDLNRSNNETNHLQSNVYLQLRPLNGLTLRTTYGIDNLLIDNDIFFNPYHGDGPSSTTGPGGAATATFSKAKTWLWTTTAQYDLTLAEKHTFSALIGNEQQRRTTDGFGLNRKTLSDSAYTVIQAGFTTPNTAGLALGENYLLSNFARLNYNFDKKYFLSGNIRRDEYSALGTKAGVFFGFSAGWEITKEKFWQSAGMDKVFSSFKLRGSYGKVGNFAGIGNFATYSTYTSGLYGGTATLGVSTVGNPNIGWETSKKTDAGFSFGFFRDRLTGEFAYYFNDINNLILSVPQAPSTGLPNILQNVGSMYNKGLEFTLNAIPVQTKDLTWSTSFNITYNKNKVTALAPGINEIINGLGGGTTEYVTKTVPGYSIGQIWVVRTAGVDPNTGRRIFLNKTGVPIYYEFGTLPAGQFNYSTATGGRYEKINPDGSKTPLTINQSDDAVLSGNTTPKFYGGWDNTVRFKNFDVNFIFTYQLGNFIYYGTNAGLRDQRFWNNSTDVLRRWKTKGEVTDIPKPVYNDNVSNGSAQPTDINVFKGDFAKLRTLQLGYNLPKALLTKGKISNARIYVSGQNLAIITKYPGSDPEVSTDGNSNATQGVDRNTLPNARTITVGLNVSF
jgi:TonB-dependent starch-binding outer membrane protein SusC